MKEEKYRKIGNFILKKLANYLTRKAKDRSKLERLLETWGKNNFLINLLAKKLKIEPRLIKEVLNKRYYQELLINIVESYSLGIFPPRLQMPALVVWNFTNSCNLNCKHCYQNAGSHTEIFKEELTLEEKFKVVDQLIEGGVSFLAFSGGEPLIHKDFWEVAKRANQKIHISVATNGTILEEVAPRLSQEFQSCALFVSLDSLDKRKHDKFRGMEGAWERTIRGIKTALQYKNLQVGINTAVTKQNLSELEDIINFARDLGCSSFTAYSYIPVGRGKGLRELDLSPLEKEKMLTILYKQYLKGGIPVVSIAPQLGRKMAECGGVSFFHYSFISKDKKRAKMGKIIAKYIGGCGVGRVYCALQPNGDVTPCVFIPEIVLGNLKRDSLKHIWQNSELLNKVAYRENTACGSCEYANYCGGCRARAYHITGSIFGSNPSCIFYKKRQQKVIAKEKFVSCSRA